MKNLIETISKKTFDIISNIGREGNVSRLAESKIIFPQKRADTKPRISEQELKQIFIEQFNLNNNYYYYSVETPTKRKYRFKGDGAPMVVADTDEVDGQSALIDMTIHDNNGNRLAIIEFKALNPDISNYHKDFIKLAYEPDTNEEVERYFIHLIPECDDQTLDNLIDKKYNFDYSDKNLTPKPYHIITLVLNDKSKKGCASLKSEFNNIYVLCKKTSTKK